MKSIQLNHAFRDLYKNLNSHNIGSLKSIYANEIKFIDPFHEVNGLSNLTIYFSSMYENVSSISFEFSYASYAENFFHQDWVMSYQHPKINKGQMVSVSGSSRIEHNSEGKIITHQDYFDSASLLYKNLPILGPIIRFINRRF